MAYVLLAQTMTMYKVDGWIPPATGIMALSFLCYAAGRLHEYGKRVNEREHSYTDGYNTATKALFSLATQATVRKVEAPPMLEKRRAARPYRQGRHAVADTGELSAALQETHRFTSLDESKAA